jgi:hypothetical protein
MRQSLPVVLDFSDNDLQTDDVWDSLEAKSNYENTIEEVYLTDDDEDEQPTRGRFLGLF